MGTYRLQRCVARHERNCLKVSLAAACNAEGVNRLRCHTARRLRLEMLGQQAMLFSMHWSFAWHARCELVYFRWLRRFVRNRFKRFVPGDRYWNQKPCNPLCRHDY
jgi:hypothetical protein